tara:strand:- start:55 stop:543 length:489 start_codon:yes stop_codon:yes gene_type:complete
MENNLARPTPYCLVVLVTQRAIESMLENSGQSIYRDTHPWVVAEQLLAQAQAEQTSMPIIFASLGDAQGAAYSHWSTVEKIDVLSLTSNRWESRCEFGALNVVNPIWQDIDSVMHKSSEEQLLREQVEGIRTLRMPLQENQIHPYAICETPAFILAELQTPA